MFNFQSDSNLTLVNFVLDFIQIFGIRLSEVWSLIVLLPPKHFDAWMQVLPLLSLFPSLSDGPLPAASTP